MSKKTKLIIGIALSTLGLLSVIMGVYASPEGNDLLEDVGYILFAIGLVFATLGSNLVGGKEKLN
jgi:hypothetical protein